MSFRKQTELTKKICKEEAARVLKKYAADFSFDHVDAEVKTLFVREASHSKCPTLFSMVKPLQERLQKEVDHHYTVGILCDINDE